MQFRLHINNTNSGTKIAAVLRDIASRIDGETVEPDQRFDYSNADGYAYADGTKIGSIDRVKLIAAILGKLNSATRKRILTDIPDDFEGFQSGDLRDETVNLIVKLEKRQAALKPNESA